MPNIRIKDIPTTASATSSTDFIGIDGSANGTRKLNAFSPTFGGNLTVSGATSTITLGSTNTGSIAVDANGGLTVTPKAGQTVTVTQTGDIVSQVVSSGTGGAAVLKLSTGNATTSSRYAYNILLSSETTPQTWRYGMFGDKNWGVYDDTSPFLTITAGTGAVGVFGNLTVSGTGTSSVAGSFGVGTATPSQLFEVAKNWNGSTWIKVSNTDTGAGAAAGVLFGNQSGDYGAISLLSSGSSPANAFFIRSLSTNVLTFGTGNTEQMRLFTTGNLFIGASPVDGGQKLQVSGGSIYSTSSSATPFIANWSTTGLFGAYRIERSGTAKAYIGLDASDNLWFGDGAVNTLLTIAPTTGNATFAGRIGLTASGTNPIYSNFIPDSTNTYAGLITMQAGGGSSAYGGGLQLYGHSHASKPGWVSANISQGSSGKFAVNNSGLGGGTDVFTVDTGGDATFAGRVKAGTAYGTANTVEVDTYSSGATNVTKTVTVALPVSGGGGSFTIEVGVYGTSSTGYGSLFVKGGGYLGLAANYDVSEIVKVNSGSVTVSSITKGNGQVTFTVLNTASTAYFVVKLQVTSYDAISTLPTITVA